MGVGEERVARRGNSYLRGRDELFVNDVIAPQLAFLLMLLLLLLLLLLFSAHRVLAVSEPLCER